MISMDWVRLFYFKIENQVDLDQIQKIFYVHLGFPIAITWLISLYPLST